MEILLRKYLDCEYWCRWFFIKDRKTIVRGRKTIWFYR